MGSSPQNTARSKTQAVNINFEGTIQTKSSEGFVK